jgi:mono/diheme cytochrome c family protein
MSAAPQAPETPVEVEARAGRRRRWLFVLLVLFLAVTYLFWRVVPQPAETFADIEAHYKYGSTGGDNSERGVPYRLWKVLPELFPEHLPGGGKAGTGYDAFGMLIEPGSDRPIGFSKRRVLGLELVGMNCAICHAGAVRATPESARQIVLGMPSNTVDLQAYFRFLFACALDERFSVDAVMERINAQGDLDAYERVAYPRAIRLFREKLLAQKQKVSYWDDPKFPRFGAGRIDTFNSVKVLGFDWGPGNFVGTNDFPSVWNQRPRREWFMHWDGNNKKMEERNISAAIGVGVQAPNSAHPDVRSTLDEPSMARVAEWVLDLHPPKFPEAKIDRAKAERGRAHFAAHCAECHAKDGARIGQVVPITDPKLGTDRERLDSFTPELSDAMNTIGLGYKWRFENFRKTDGYANQLLDGIWLRGPYLHNGSVPTLRALLNAPAARPKKFRRGNDVYDWADVGFDSTTATEGARAYFEFDTTKTGNGNFGHTYGTELPAPAKDELLEYLKTL